MKTCSTKPRFCLGVSTVKQREHIGWENVTTTSNHQPSQYDEFDSLFHGQVSWCERMLNLFGIVNWSTPDVLLIHQIIIFDGFYPWMFRLINGWLSWTPSHQPHENGSFTNKTSCCDKTAFSQPKLIQWTQGQYGNTRNQCKSLHHEPQSFCKASNNDSSANILGVRIGTHSSSEPTNPHSFAIVGKMMINGKVLGQCFGQAHFWSWWFNMFQHFNTPFLVKFSILGGKRHYAWLIFGSKSMAVSGILE